MEMAPNVEKISRFPAGEESCHVCGCHGFSVPNIYFEPKSLQGGCLTVVRVRVWGPKYINGSALTKWVNLAQFWDVFPRFVIFFAKLKLIFLF